MAFRVGGLVRSLGFAPCVPWVTRHTASHRPSLTTAKRTRPIAARVANGCLRTMAMNAGGDSNGSEALPTRDQLLSASFRDSVSHAATIMRGVASEIPEEKGVLLDAMLSSSNGARGFFVTLLSEEDVTIADADPLPPGLVSLLQRYATSETVADLLVKNLVMSTAMVHYYEAANQSELAGNSARTARRAEAVLRAAKADGEVGEVTSSVIMSLAREMIDGLLHESAASRYKEFGNKWGYNKSQREAASAALVRACGIPDSS